MRWERSCGCLRGEVVATTMRFSSDSLTAIDTARPPWFTRGGAMVSSDEQVQPEKVRAMARASRGGLIEPPQLRRAVCLGSRRQNEADLLDAAERFPYRKAVSLSAKVGGGFGSSTRRGRRLLDSRSRLAIRVERWLRGAVRRTNRVVRRLLGAHRRPVGARCRPNGAARGACEIVSWAKGTRRDVMEIDRRLEGVVRRVSGSGRRTNGDGRRTNGSDRRANGSGRTTNGRGRRANGRA